MKKKLEQRPIPRVTECPPHTPYCHVTICSPSFFLVPIGQQKIKT